MSIPSTCLSVAFLRLHRNTSPTEELWFPPAWALAQSLGTGGCLVSIHGRLGHTSTLATRLPGGSRSPPHPAISSPTSAKVYARLPTSGAPDVSPVSLPPSPLQCLFFAICPHLDLLIPGDWGLPKGTNSDSGLLGAQGSAWQTSGAQKPSTNLLVSRKLGLSAKNLVKSSKPHALLQSRENWGPVVEPSCMKTIGESPAPVIENRVRFCIPPTSRSGPCSCLEGALDRHLVCSLRWSPTSAPLVLGVADPHAPVVSGWVHGLDLTHHPIR